DHWRGASGQSSRTFPRGLNLRRQPLPKPFRWAHAREVARPRAPSRAPAKATADVGNREMSDELTLAGMAADPETAIGLPIPIDADEALLGSIYDAAKRI